MAEDRELPSGIDRVLGTPRKKDGKRPTLYRVRLTWKGKQVTVGRYRTLTLARSALQNAREEVVTKTFIPPGERRRLEKELAEAEKHNEVTVRAWSVLWLDAVRDAGASPATITTYESALRAHILNALGVRRLVDVTPAHVKEMLDGIPTRGARDNAYRVTRAMFAAAVKAKAGNLESSPMAEIAAPKKARRNLLTETRILSAAEIDLIARNMPDHLAIGPVLAAWCALRLGELLGLQRRDFRDLDRPEEATLSIERQWLTKQPSYALPKAGSVRRISIMPAIVPVIVHHLEHYTGKEPDAPLIPGRRDPSKPISQTVFDKAWREAREPVRPGFRFHDLRHTGLSLYAQSGATLRELMQRGGHTNIETALIYQHADLTRDRANVARMEELAKGN